MTIGGALSELNNLLKADDIPFYYKPSIKAVMDTIALSNLEKPNKWIPVSESPKELGTYLIQTDGEPYMCQCRWTDVNPFWTDYKTKPHWNIFDLPQYSKVIAWMPLPEPYTAESEDKE